MNEELHALEQEAERIAQFDTTATWNERKLAECILTLVHYVSLLHNRIK